MSRGFGATFGTNTNDIVTSTIVITPPTLNTISVWFNSNGQGTSGFGQAYNIGNSFGIEFGNGGLTSIYFDAKWTTSAGGGAQWHCPCSGSGVWQHIAVTYDGSSSANKPTMYINGIAKTVTQQVTPSGALNFVSSSPSFGGSGAFSWDGLLSNGAYWAGILLNPSEILSLASGINPLLIRPDSLISYIPLDGVSNPELDLVSKCASVTGAKFSKSDPPILPVPLSRTIRLFDYETDKVSAAFVAKFRRTISMDGTRVGSRQAQAS